MATFFAHRSDYLSVFLKILQIHHQGEPSPVLSFFVVFFFFTFCNMCTRQHSNSQGLFVVVEVNCGEVLQMGCSHCTQVVSKATLQGVKLLLFFW